MRSKFALILLLFSLTLGCLAQVHHGGFHRTSGFEGLSTRLKNNDAPKSPEAVAHEEEDNHDRYESQAARTPNGPIRPGNGGRGPGGPGPRGPGSRGPPFRGHHGPPPFRGPRGPPPFRGPQGAALRGPSFHGSRRGSFHEEEHHHDDHHDDHHEEHHHTEHHHRPHHRMRHHRLRHHDYDEY